VLGKPVRFQQIIGEAYKARLLWRGMSEAMAQGNLDMWVAYDQGLDSAEQRRRVHYPHQFPPVVRGSAAYSCPGLNATATEDENEMIERKQCMELAGKVVLITGASSGIGLATTRLFARKGAKLALAARSTEKLAQLVSELPDALAVPTDLRDEAAVRRMVTQTREHYQRIDVLINNAGQGQFAPIEKMNLEIYRTMFEVNVISVIAAMQEVIPIMRAQGGGVIINISSGASKAPPESFWMNPIAPYVSTKYALNAITLIGRQQLTADNIFLGLVYPGVTATNFFNTLLEGRQPASAPVGATDVASPESVAETILEAVETQAAEVYTEDLKQALSSSGN
jgi:NADP-dependent 3-hydroxy acid dehydrogenase YdfG